MNLGLTLMHFLLLVPRLERLLEIPGIREFVNLSTGTEKISGIKR